MSILLTSCGQTSVSSENPTTSETTSEESSSSVEEDTVEIADMYTWLDYPAVEFFPKFSNPDKKEKLTFEYDSEKLEIDEENYTIRGLQVGRFRVKAVSENYACQFAVKVSEVDKTLSYFTPEAHWQTYVDNTLAPLWDKQGRAGHTTVFIGDSFFDEANFWTDFYEDYYPNKDALCFGIGSTTSYTWETLTDTFLKDLNMKNLVINVGTNNIYDIYGDKDQTIENLERMFVVMHDRLPNTKLYYFSINQRGYETFRKECTITNEVNSAIQEWCENRDWITYMDSCSLMTVDMLKTDKIHPKLTSYSIFKELLEQTDIEIEDL